ncbi:MAG: hypothetical protein ACFFDS_07350, partial [Candidatus Thorarchaeota archaeon]
MKKIAIVLIVSIVIIGAITPIIVINIKNSKFDPSKLVSEIKRDVFDENYLSILLSLEDISGDCNYFDEIRGYDFLEGNIKNISKLIENEECFLSAYNPKDFTPKEWRYHKFIYHGTLSSGINATSLLNIINSYPTFLFYYNFSATLFHSITSYNESTSDSELWNI